MSKSDPEDVSPKKSAKMQESNTNDNPRFDMILFRRDVAWLVEATSPEAVPASISSPTLIPPRCIAA